ncbi:MAG TPA: carbohydrate porin [Gemmatimonadaceae bacterium]|nr:carbohydrate porin [Gemmatimonadaceae bacterium]
MAHPGWRARIRLAVLSSASVLLAASAVRAQGVVADSAALPRYVTALSYTGEVVANVRGGAGRGAAYVGLGGAEITLIMPRLVGWPGATIFLSALGEHGGAPSDLVGDVQGVSNLETEPVLRLGEAWLQQNVLENRMSWLVGLYDVNAEFYRLTSGALFINSSFGTGPEFAQSGRAGLAHFPNPGLGSRVELDPLPNVAWRFAVGTPSRREVGGVRLAAPGSDVLFVSELAVVARADTMGVPRQRRFRPIGRGLPRPYAAKAALGAWYYPGRFPDLVDTLATGAPVRHRGSAGLYLLGDATVWSAGEGRPQALTAFAQLGVGDARVEQVRGYVGGGLTFSALFPGREDDAIGLGVAAALNGSHFERAQEAIGIPAAGETAVELTYLAEFGDWLAIQPDAQLVVHPGGTRATRNALVFGLRVAVSR